MQYISNSYRLYFHNVSGIFLFLWPAPLPHWSKSPPSCTWVIEITLYGPPCLSTHCLVVCFQHTSQSNPWKCVRSCHAFFWNPPMTFQVSESKRQRFYYDLHSPHDLTPRCSLWSHPLLLTLWSPPSSHRGLLTLLNMPGMFLPWTLCNFVLCAWWTLPPGFHIEVSRTHSTQMSPLSVLVLDHPSSINKNSRQCPLSLLYFSL